MILKKSLPVMRYEVKYIKYCFAIFSETTSTKEIVMLFSGMIDLLNYVCIAWMSMPAVTSGSHRK